MLAIDADSDAYCCDGTFYCSDDSAEFVAYMGGIDCPTLLDSCPLLPDPNLPQVGAEQNLTELSPAPALAQASPADLFGQYCVYSSDCTSTATCVDFINSHASANYTAITMSPLWTIDKVREVLAACLPTCRLLHGTPQKGSTSGCSSLTDGSTILDYANSAYSFPRIGVDRSTAATCNVVQILDLSRNPNIEHRRNTIRSLFVGVNARLLPDLRLINLSHSALTTCPNMTRFANHTPNSLTLDLSGNNIVDCAAEVFCGVRGVFTKLILTDNALGSDNVTVNVSSWFNCPDNALARRHRRDVTVLLIDLSGNSDLTTVVAVGDNIGISVFDTQVADHTTLPGNCAWNAIINASIGAPTEPWNIAHGNANRDEMPTDGGTFSAECAGNTRYRVDDTVILPDCCSFDSVTAEMTWAGCTTADTFPDILTITRYDPYSPNGLSEDVLRLAPHVYKFLVKHAMETHLITNTNYDLAHRTNNPYKISNKVEVAAVSACSLVFTTSDLLPSWNTLLFVNDTGDPHDGGVFGGSLLITGTTPATPSTTNVVIRVSDSCTDTVLEVNSIAVRLVPSLDVTANVTIVPTGSNTTHSVGSTIEIEQDTAFNIGDWTIALGVDSDRASLVHAFTFEAGLSEGLQIVQPDTLEEGVISVYGTANTLGSISMWLNVTETNGVVSAQDVIRDRTRVRLRVGDGGAHEPTIIVTVVECLDYGSKCHFRGTCNDRSNNRTDGIFDCTCTDPAPSGHSLDQYCEVIAPSPAAADAAAAGINAVIISVSGVMVLLILILLLLLFLKKRQNKYQQVGPWQPPPPDRFERDPAMLMLSTKLGQGQFGTVYLGELRSKSRHRKNGTALKVAVKQCSIVNPTVEQKIEFLAEGDLMKPFNHPKVMRLIGIVTQSEPFMLIIEHMAKGDLQEYLTAIRLNEKPSDVTETDLLMYCIDLVEGLSYLAQHNFVHRDIAARNLLLSGENTVKITDFGLSRKIDTKSDYYRQGGITMLPVRWMAPECLSDGKFTAASDMWSFSVCAWEIFSGGVIPYSTLTNSEIYTELMQGTRLGQPFYMPVAMYEICHDCWIIKADDRPDHDEVQNSLAAVRQESLWHAVQAPVDFGLSDHRSSSLVSSSSNMLRTAVGTGVCIVTSGTGEEQLYDDDAVRANDDAASGGGPLTPGWADGESLRSAAAAARLAARVSSVLSSEDGSVASDDDAGYEPIGQRRPGPAFYAASNGGSSNSAKAETWSRSVYADASRDGHVPVGQRGSNARSAVNGMYVYGQNGAPPIVSNLSAAKADATLEGGNGKLEPAVAGPHLPAGQTGNAELYAAAGSLRPAEAVLYMPLGQMASSEQYSPAAGQALEVALPRGSRDGVVVNFIDNKPPPAPLAVRPSKNGRLSQHTTTS